MADNVAERYTIEKDGTKMTVEILVDGTIKSTTGHVGPQVHQNAEGFFGMLGRLLGGKTTITRRGDNAHAKHSASQRVSN
jgi:hypothetical protein